MSAETIENDCSHQMKRPGIPIVLLLFIGVYQWILPWHFDEKNKVDGGASNLTTKDPI